MARHGSDSRSSSVLRRIGLALISARARAIMSIGIVLGLGAVGTLAAWSDTATATSGVFTTGRIDIQLNGSNAQATMSTLNKLNLVPGDTLAADIIVNNAGTVPFNYKITAAASGASIGAVLSTSFYTGTAAGNECTGSLVGTLAPMTLTAQPLKLSGTDANVPLGAGVNAPMCMSVTMPLGTSVPDPAASGSINYSFEATST